MGRFRHLSSFPLIFPASLLSSSALEWSRLAIPMSASIPSILGSSPSLMPANSATSGRLRIWPLWPRRRPARPSPRAPLHVALILGSTDEVSDTRTCGLHDRTELIMVNSREWLRNSVPIVLFLNDAAVLPLDRHSAFVADTSFPLAGIESWMRTWNARGVFIHHIGSVAAMYQCRFDRNATCFPIHSNDIGTK
ncbi:hypothetical protein FB451DRAFT_1190209 [Mycena latifolia]|nr:hypothetical protein FB451DRAFT_1190209 [Mycena latifolia]